MDNEPNMALPFLLTLLLASAGKAHISLASEPSPVHRFHHSRDKMHSISLHQAARHGLLACVRRLLSSRICVNPVDEFGQTPLHKAAIGGHCAVALELLRHGAHARATDMYQQTALHKAARKGHLSIVQTLLHYLSPEQVNDLDNFRQTALYKAVHWGYTCIFDHLIAAGASIETGRCPRPLLHMATQFGHLGMMRKLLAAGAEVSELDSCRKTALHHAIYNADGRTLHTLLKAGAQTDIPSDWNALHAALSLGKRSLVALLLKHGAEYFTDSERKYTTSVNTIQRQLRRNRTAVIVEMARRGVAWPAALLIPPTLKPIWKQHEKAYEDVVRNALCAHYIPSDIQNIIAKIATGKHITRGSKRTVRHEETCPNKKLRVKKVDSDTARRAYYS